jgi:hypothetical protein
MWGNIMQVPKVGLSGRGTSLYFVRSVTELTDLEGCSYGDGPLRQAWSVLPFPPVSSTSLLTYVSHSPHAVRYFDQTQPSGSRWSKAGMGNVDRMYHSTASLLLDGSVIVSGSNPNADCESRSSVSREVVSQEG